jgi:uncharacterized protein
MAKAQGKSVADFVGSGAKQLLKIPEAKSKLGEFTLKDIVSELEKPGRDPRDVFVPVQFRDDLSELKDVKPGMVCPGVVTNVTNFGAFVDIGVHQDGLVHISQLGQKFVTDPSQVVSPGDKVTVRVLEVNLEKSQMSLTMRMDEKPVRATASQEAKPLTVSYAGDKRPVPSGGKTFTPKSPDQRPRPRPESSGGSRGFSSEKPGQAFNNAFAGLASLKSSLKK